MTIKHTETDEICQACCKSKTNHNLEEIQDCSKKLIEMGIMRFCGLCGVTKPADGFPDRCEKCGEEYSFTNE